MEIDSAVQDKQVTPKRPKLVWIITIFYFISAGWTLLSFSLIYSGAISINEAQRLYFNSQTMVDIILTLAICILNLAGAFLLFILKRKAFYAFIYAFIISMFMTVYHVLFKNWLAAIGGPGLVGAMIGWGISIAVIIYSNSLIKKDILQ